MLEHGVDRSRAQGDLRSQSQEHFHACSRADRTEIDDSDTAMLRENAPVVDEIELFSFSGINCLEKFHTIS